MEYSFAEKINITLLWSGGGRVDDRERKLQMATSAEWHEGYAQMSESARNFSRAVKSVQEELEAVNWYNKHLRTYLFTEGDITQIEEQAENP